MRGGGLPGRILAHGTPLLTPRVPLLLTALVTPLLAPPPCVVVHGGGEPMPLPCVVLMHSGVGNLYLRPVLMSLGEGV